MTEAFTTILRSLLHFRFDLESLFICTVGYNSSLSLGDRFRLYGAEDKSETKFKVLSLISSVPTKKGLGDNGS